MKLRLVLLAALTAMTMLGAPVGHGYGVKDNRGGKHEKKPHKFKRRVPVGAVYTMTNDLAGNRVLVFDRMADGSLEAAGSYATRGQGSGVGLENQGAVVLSEDERWLFAVNAGSSDFSVFRVRNRGLELTDKISSGGIQPISVTTHGDLVYVLNEGGSGGIAGFEINRRGKLSPLAGSLQPLSGAGVDPAQISFGPWGRVLAVTEKNTDKILTYVVNRAGIARPPIVNESAGQTPYGFAFGKRGQLIVSEAAGGAPGASTASSYQVRYDGSLEVISAAVSANSSAACWVTVTPNGRYAFTSNTGSNDLSAFEIGFDGEIELQDNVSTGPGSAPLDSALTNNSRFLYVFNNGTGTLSGFRLERDGDLEEIPLGIGGISGSNGLAAR